jgi:hypothetical protein
MVTPVNATTPAPTAKPPAQRKAAPPAAGEQRTAKRARVAAVPAADPRACITNTFLLDKIRSATAASPAEGRSQDLLIESGTLAIIKAHVLDMVSALFHRHLAEHVRTHRLSAGVSAANISMTLFSPAVSGYLGFMNQVTTQLVEQAIIMVNATRGRTLTRRVLVAAIRMQQRQVHSLATFIGTDSDGGSPYLAAVRADLDTKDAVRTAARQQQGSAAPAKKNAHTTA